MWRGGHMGLLLSLALSAALIVSCVDASGGPDGSEPTPQVGSQPGTTTGSQPGTTTTGSPTTESSVAPGAVCDIPPGRSFEEGDSVGLVELGTVNGSTVSGAVYPRPDYEGNPWSQWGQGIALDDGRFYSAIGDHLGTDGNSYVYEYDPESNDLKLVGDILSYVDHVPGTWGYGKVHSQMVPGPCGEIYFSTYWGTSRGLEFEGNYRGDLIFRIDPYDRTLQPLTVPVELHGQASLASDPASGLVYGEAADPVEREEGGPPGPFFAYDVNEEQTVFVSDIRSEVGYRSILVDREGTAYWSMGGGELQSYDPTSGQSARHEARLPGDWLRAVTEPAPDGTVYGVTREPDAFFAMTADGEISSLGAALGYTASVALAPDGSSFFYMPGAHGNSSEWGSPLIRVDTTTGEQTVVAELDDLVMEQLGYLVGGTYSVVVGPDGQRVFLGVNAGQEGESFGEVILLVIDLP